MRLLTAAVAGARPYLDRFIVGQSNGHAIIVIIVQSVLWGLLTICMFDKLTNYGIYGGQGSKSGFQLSKLYMYHIFVSINMNFCKTKVY